MVLNMSIAELKFYKSFKVRELLGILDPGVGPR